MLFSKYLFLATSGNLSECWTCYHFLTGSFAKNKDPIVVINFTNAFDFTMAHKREFSKKKKKKFSEIACCVQTFTQSSPVPCLFLIPHEMIPRDTGRPRSNQSNTYDYDKSQNIFSKENITICKVNTNYFSFLPSISYLLTMCYNKANINITDKMYNSTLYMGIRIQTIGVNVGHTPLSTPLSTCMLNLTNWKLPCTGP